MLTEIRAVFLRDLDAAVREVEAYPSDDALWHVIPGTTNSGGALARHLAGNMRHFIGALIGKSGYVRNRDAEFTGSGLTRAAVADELRAAAVEVDAALGALATPARLADAAKILSGPFPVAVAGKQFTVAQFLVHLVSHFGYHLGQLDYHRRSQDAASKPVNTMALDALPTA